MLSIYIKNSLKGSFVLSLLKRPLLIIDSTSFNKSLSNSFIDSIASSGLNFDLPLEPSSINYNPTYTANSVGYETSIVLALTAKFLIRSTKGFNKFEPF